MNHDTRTTTHGWRAWWLMLALACLLLATRAMAETAIPAAEGHVTDAAHVLADPARARLEAFLAQVQERTGAQFAVLTIDSTGDETPDTYKVRVFKAWGIGTKGRDDGLLLLVAMKEHRLEFETGYGLEGTLPDGWEARMLRETAVPLMREGDAGGAVTAAMLAAAKRVADEKGVTLQWNGEELRYDDERSGRRRLPSWLIAFVILLIIQSVMRGLLGRGGGVYYGGGWGGGFGGGWGGGGGGGGGGFGGFGGGSSGGGGGGAGW